MAQNIAEDLIRQEMIAILEERELRKRRALDPLSYITFLPWQEKLLHEPHHCQILMGSNRAGKTEYGAMVTGMLLEGRHPWQTDGFVDTITGDHKYLPMPPHKGDPYREFIIRVILTDLNMTLNHVVLPKIKRYVAPHLYIKGDFERSYDRQRTTLTMADGAVIQFMSNRQKIEKFSGSSLVMAWHDEQPKQEIWHESVLRTTDLDGLLLLTASLNQGVYSWIADLIDDLKTRSKINAQDVKIQKVSIRDNIFLDQTTVNKKAALLTDEERSIKIDGDLGELGLVYSNFKDETPWVVEDFDIPDHWTLAVVVDYHATKDVCLQHWAIDPDNNYYIFREDRIDEQGKDAIVKACWDTFCERTYYHHYIETRGSATRDRLHHQGKSAYELLRDAGWVELTKTKTKSLAKATACEAGALALNSLFEINKETKKPRLQIFSSCTLTRRDIRRLRRKRAKPTAQYSDMFDDTKFDFAACARVGAYEDLWYVSRSEYVNETDERKKRRHEKRMYSTGY